MSDAKLAVNRVKEFRQKRGLTAYQLSQRVGCRENTIYRYEMGFNPSPIAKQALANALEASIEDLFPQESQPATAEAK